MRNLDKKVVENVVCGVIAIAGYVAIKVGVNVIKDKQVLDKVKQGFGKIKLLNKTKDVQVPEEEV